jgi:drug/metabolite transporter (DMT)-like permease
LALLGQTVISAGTYLVAKRTLSELTPVTLVLCRFAVCASLFMAMLAFAGQPKLPPTEAWARVLFLGVLAGPVNQGLFFWGLARSRPAHAALLYALTPVGVFVVSLLRGSERPRLRALLGITLAFSGVLVLLIGQGLMDGVGPLKGDLAILAAVLAWVLYTSEGKELTSRHGFFRASAWTMTAGAIATLPLAPAGFDLSAVTGASGVAWAGILYLGVLTSVVSYLLWYFALGRTDASKVAVFSNLQPVATALAAWAVLGDPLSVELLVGGAMVLFGVRLTQTAY